VDHDQVTQGRRAELRETEPTGRIRRRAPRFEARIDEVRHLSAEVNRLHDEMRRLAWQRDHSAADRDRWLLACREFRLRFEELRFPGGDDGWSSFIAGDPEGLDSAIAFVEADPYFHRSGYLKQDIWDRLKRSTLDAAQLNRLEAISLGYVTRPVRRREFWHMVRFVRQRAGDSFWSALREIDAGPDRPARTRARWVLLARLNYPVRNWVGSERLRSRYQLGYVPDFRFEAFDIEAPSRALGAGALRPQT
jgi:hypothetical protein